MLQLATSGARGNSDMTPKALREACEHIFGSSAWVSDAVPWLRVNRTTIFRWLSGESKVPGPVQTLIEERLAQKGKK